MLYILASFFLLGLYAYRRFTGWFSGAVCTADRRLDGRMVVVTGGNTGIGKETVRELVIRGAKIITGCRDVEKAKRAALEFKEQTGQDIIIEPLDLADVQSVKKFAARCLQESRLDILVNNAGVMMPVKGIKTKQNFEIHMGVNYLGHYLLTSLLYPLMRKTGTQHCPARLVNVSSEGHRFTLFAGQDVDDPKFGLPEWAAGYTGPFSFHQLYGQSKLAQIYHAKEVDRLAKEKGEHVIAVSLHPGAVATEITRHHNEGFFTAVTSIIENGLLFFGKTPLEGAQTTLHCCLADSLFLTGGGYYVDCALQDLPTWYNKRQQTKLREVSDMLLGIESSEPLLWNKAYRN